MKPDYYYQILKDARTKMSHNEASAVDKLYEMAMKYAEHGEAESVAYNGDVILRYGMTPLQVVNELVEACYKEENTEVVKALTGSSDTYNDVFSVYELEAIAKHLLVYVEMMKKDGE